MNINKLKGKLAERGWNVEKLADAIGSERSTLYRKFSNFEKLTIGDATKIKIALDLSNADAIEIFLD